MNDINSRNYEKLWEQTEEDNNYLLAAFEEDMSALSSAARNRHLTNVKLFINDYFYKKGIESVVEGVLYMHEFFLHVTAERICETADSVRKLATSIRKFYTRIYNEGYISHFVKEEALMTIEFNLDTWKNQCNA